ncbi:hypothetical protein BLGI_1997 [Brevibacillus laterosporus GI-9]|nr:hypothetical protein BLGI_1997 [Brevibacillus laterosporus GI-9]
MFSTILEQNVLVKKWILEQIERNSVEGESRCLGFLMQDIDT